MSPFPLDKEHAISRLLLTKRELESARHNLIVAQIEVPEGSCPEAGIHWILTQTARTHINLAINAVSQTLKNLGVKDE